VLRSHDPLVRLLKPPQPSLMPHEWSQTRNQGGQASTMTSVLLLFLCWPARTGSSETRTWFATGFHTDDFAFPRISVFQGRFFPEPARRRLTRKIRRKRRREPNDRQQKIRVPLNGCHEQAQNQQKPVRRPSPSDPKRTHSEVFTTSNLQKKQSTCPRSEFA